MNLRFFKITIFVVLIVFTKNNCHLFEDPLTWSNPEIITLLKTEEIASIETIQNFLEQQGKKYDFTATVFLVTLKNGIKAVFKPKNLDEELIFSFAEVAAYKASLFLGFPHIPPTILRTINGKNGSLQLYISTETDLLIPENYKQALDNADKDDLANLKLFYFIFGQWDSGPHNLLLYKNLLIAIDNEGIANRQQVLDYGQLPFVSICYREELNTHDWEKTFPFDQAKTLQNPSKEFLKIIFKDTLPESFYKNFKSYNSPLRYVIYQNRFWRQYHAFNTDFIKSYTTYCPIKTLAALKKLNLKILKEIFFDAPEGSNFLDEKFLNTILKRRDMVINFFLLNKKI